MHSPIGGTCEMDFEWELSNTPVWLDSLQLFFYLKHSTLFTVFHNFKTLSPCLPKSPAGLQAQQLALLRIRLRDDALSAPHAGAVAVSPADGIGTEVEALCKSSPLRCSSLAQLWFFSSIFKWERTSRRKHPPQMNHHQGLYPASQGSPLPVAAFFSMVFCSGCDGLDLSSLY